MSEQPVKAPEGLDPETARTLKAEGLRFVSDRMPGIRREKHGDGFRYFDPKGHEIDDESELSRIRKLAIPPAYTDVWIAPIANGYLQATGRDARGRKQYRYHARWREVRDENKFERMLEFGRALPKIRERVRGDLELAGFPREKVLATVVRLLEKTLIRVGNEEYVRANGSYGLTTMRNRHVKVTGSRLRFEFKGKSGKRHSIEVEAPRCARLVRRLRDLPGQELFQYMGDDGEPRTVDSGDVNLYLKEISGGDFSAKDFRTWYGTVLALELLAEAEASSAAEARRVAKEALGQVAERLGNTPAICKKSYVHPRVLERFTSCALADDLRRCVRKKGIEGLQDGEVRLLALLQRAAREERNGKQRSAIEDALAGSRAMLKDSRRAAKQRAIDTGEKLVRKRISKRTDGDVVDRRVEAGSRVPEVAS